MHSGMHHYHERKRAHATFVQWPHPHTVRRVVDRMVYFVSAFAIVMTLPQFVQVWFEKNAEGVSVWSWSAYSFTSLFWLVYGIVHKEHPLIINYGIWVVLNALIAFGAWRYH